MFDSTFAAFVAFSVILIMLMTWGLIWGPPEIVAEEGSKQKETNDFLKILIVFLFFSATIVNLGIRWSARIIAGRRYRRSDLRPAAAAFAVSQVVCFAVYGLFHGAVLYYRFASRGDKSVLVVATLAAVLASFYFLRLPSFLLHSAFGPQAGREGDPGKEA
jgi:hypothetical protein